MYTTHNGKKMIASALGVAAAAVAAPALLFTGAGTAQADDWTDCGDRVFAGPDTSCPFAQDVRERYMPIQQEGSVMINVYSPVTQETYTMNCVRGGNTDNSVNCRGGDNAIVTFIVD
jgi:hypothetical protein